MGEDSSVPTSQHSSHGAASSREELSRDQGVHSPVNAVELTRPCALLRDLSTDSNHFELSKGKDCILAAGEFQQRPLGEKPSI
jgi:hypothetical protein